LLLPHSQLMRAQSGEPPSDNRFLLSGEKHMLTYLCSNGVRCAWLRPTQHKTTEKQKRNAQKKTYSLEWQSGVLSVFRFFKVRTSYTVITARSKPRSYQSF
jgi:hypothetical protein